MYFDLVVRNNTIRVLKYVSLQKIIINLIHISIPIGVCKASTLTYALRLRNLVQAFGSILGY